MFLEKYVVQYVSKQHFTFVKSVAVHSINTFFVFSVIFEWSPLIIGGSDNTIPLLSVITGYTELSLMIGKYCLSWAWV